MNTEESGKSGNVGYEVSRPINAIALRVSADRFIKTQCKMICVSTSWSAL